MNVKSDGICGLQLTRCLHIKESNAILLLVQFLQPIFKERRPTSLRYQKQNVSSTGTHGGARGQLKCLILPTLADILLQTAFVKRMNGGNSKRSVRKASLSSRFLSSPSPFRNFKLILLGERFLVNLKIQRGHFQVRS